jgi:hypothetical protein
LKADVLILRYAWLLFVFVTCANGAVWWYRGRRKMAANPELRSGYRRLIRYWLIYGNLPWLVMGAGILFGSVPSIWHYFSLRNGPFAIAFNVTIVALWIAAFYWLFFRGGVEDLVTHPGLLRSEVTPRALKVFFLLTLAGGVFAFVTGVLGDIPLTR